MLNLIYFEKLFIQIKKVLKHALDHQTLHKSVPRNNNKSQGVKSGPYDGWLIKFRLS